MPDEFEIADVIPASPEKVYEAWLNGKGHSDMTGGAAEASDVVDAEFTAWDGYIRGTNLELEPHTRIVQAWRTTQFPKTSADSRLEVLLEADDEGTRIVLRHTEIPEGQGKNYRQGWVDHYFEPMKKHFSR